ncbi:MAG: DUF559 domain-containing protein [Desulfobulbus sp.]|nr:DUF559 domain-containing protein [Desulfobulbus sp.]
MTDGLKDTHRRALLDILSANQRVERVVLFGSRAMGTYTPASDVDLVLYGDALTLTDQARLAAAIDELPMPQRVDLVLFKAIDNDKLKEHIRKHGVEWFRRDGGMGIDLSMLGYERLPKGWQILSLESVCEGVFDCPHSTPKITDRGPLLARTQDIRSGYFTVEEAAHVSIKTYQERIVRAEPRYGDLLLSREGTYFGNAAEVPKNTLVCLGQRMVLLRPNNNIVISSFLRLWINSDTFQKYLLGFRDGSVAERLNLTTIRKLPVVIPPLPHQTFVVQQIVPIETKAANCRAINQTLEEIAQALFKSWFVDFEPTKAKIKAKRSSQRPPLPPGEGPGVRVPGLRPPLPPDLLNNARRLRQQLTDAERLLWQLLRGRQLAGCKFRRQHPIGNFILDFYCHDKLLAVELDGGQHNDPNQREADERRTAWLAEQGIRVLRFWNNEVLQETEGVLEEIFRHLTGPAPHPRPLSRGDRGEEVVADFVERAAMCAISGKTDDELDRLPAEQFAQLRDTAALFPDELVESELGMIPEGWAWKSLDAIAHYQNGLALQKYRPKDNFDFLPIVKIAQLKAGVATSEEKASPDITPACIIDNGDVVFSWSGSLMVDIWCGGKAALNQHLFKVTSEACPKWFYYHWTQYHLAKFQQIAADKAVTMGHIKREHLHEAMCAVPNFDPEDLHIMTQLIERQVAARLENNSLTQLRDTLLTKLLSGEISVNKAGEDIKEAI